MRYMTEERHAKKLRKERDELIEVGNTSQLSDMYLKSSFNKSFCMNNAEIAPYKAPKILGDVFEAIIGAIFVDSGIDEVNRVLKTLMAPFVLYVAKFSKQIHKEPKEDFWQLATQLEMWPKWDYHQTEGGKPKTVKLSEVLERPIAEADDVQVPMQQVSIIYNNGEVMATSYGYTKAQAERNVSLLGLKWLKANKAKEISTLLKSAMFKQSLKACFMQHENLAKFVENQ